MLVLQLGMVMVRDQEVEGERSLHKERPDLQSFCR